MSQFSCWWARVGLPPRAWVALVVRDACVDRVEVPGTKLGDTWLLLVRPSPDGRLIVGRILKHGGLEGIAVYDTASATARKVSDRTSTFSWLPDDRRLIVFEPHPGLLIVDVVTGRERIVSGRSLVGMEADAVRAVSSDGRTLFVNVHRTESDIWMASAQAPRR